MVSDGVATSATTAVIRVNRDPEAVDNRYEVREEDTLVVTAPGVLVNDVDADGDEVTVCRRDDDVDANRTDGVVVALTVDGGLVYEPSTGFVGEDAFDYVVFDDANGVATATVRVTVTPRNAPPVAGWDAYETYVDAEFEVSAAEGVAANDSDPDGPDEVLTVTTVLAEPEHGTLTYLNEDGSIASAPNNGSFGVDEFRYDICDTDGLTVAAVDGLLSNDDDPDGDTLTVVDHALPRHGDRSFVYLPRPGFLGTDAFGYTVECLLATP